MQDIEGRELQLSQFKGKVVLVVNVASECGFTPQYKVRQLDCSHCSRETLVDAPAERVSNPSSHLPGWLLTSVISGNKSREIWEILNIGRSFFHAVSGGCRSRSTEAKLCYQVQYTTLRESDMNDKSA